VPRFRPIRGGHSDPPPTLGEAFRGAARHSQRAAEHGCAAPSGQPRPQTQTNLNAKTHPRTQTHSPLGRTSLSLVRISPSMMNVRTLRQASSATPLLSRSASSERRRLGVAHLAAQSTICERHGHGHAGCITVSASPAYGPTAAERWLRSAGCGARPALVCARACVCVCVTPLCFRACAYPPGLQAYICSGSPQSSLQGL
jgi:hypothetical protein